MEKAFTNGSLWRHGKEVVLLQQLTGELFCLLNVNESGVFSLAIDPVHAGKWQYSSEEIPERLEGWEQQAGHVSVEQPTKVVIQEADPAEEIRARKAAAEKKTLSSVKRKVKDGKV